jgi:hypothetical protein
MVGRTFTATDAEAAAIRTAFEQGGEFSATAELRRLFLGVTDSAEVRLWVRHAELRHNGGCAPKRYPHLISGIVHEKSCRMVSHITLSLLLYCY